MLFIILAVFFLLMLACWYFSMPIKKQPVISKGSTEQNYEKIKEQVKNSSVDFWENNPVDTKQDEKPAQSNGVQTDIIHETITFREWIGDEEYFRIVNGR